jgi:hypothetical protein
MKAKDFDEKVDQGEADKTEAASRSHDEDSAGGMG